MRSTRFLAIIVALPILVGAGLSGCSGESTDPTTPTATRTSSASAADTSTPSPSPTPRASSIVVGMTSMKVLDQSGYLMEEISYATPGPDVAAHLTELFGVTPVESDYAGGLEVWPAHVYDWAGFILGDELREGAMYVPYYEYVVSVKTASVNGIEIRTEAGTRVGDPASSVTYDPTSPWGVGSYAGMTCGAEALFSETGDIDNSVTLWVCSDDASGLVNVWTVPAPMQN